LDPFGRRCGQLACSCERGNELSGSLGSGEFLG
jgi:hypothetical protein